VLANTWFAIYTLRHIISNSLCDKWWCSSTWNSLPLRQNNLCRFGKYSLSWLNYPCSEYVLYDIGLCSKYSVSVFKRMEACYNKFIKSFLNTVGLTVLVTCWVSSVCRVFILYSMIMCTSLPSGGWRLLTELLDISLDHVRSVFS